jgi:hypothetical protein
VTALRAIDAAPLVEGCVTGEPLSIEEPDPEDLAWFWRTYLEILDQRRRARREEVS